MISILGDGVMYHNHHDNIISATVFHVLISPHLEFIPLIYLKGLLLLTWLLS